VSGQGKGNELIPYECTKERILDTIRDSEVPEDYDHALNTLMWVRKLRDDNDPLLEIAALGHDIERAMEEVKVKRGEFADYDSFKRAHAENSARIVSQIMRECGWDEASVCRVADMIRLHETGGDEMSDLLRDADALSFFEVNLPHYFKRHDLGEVEARCRWGYNRISSRHRHLVGTFQYPDQRINSVLKSIVR